MGKIIDSHAHACGEYLTEESIRLKLEKSGCQQIVLTPGQYGSKKTYNLKDKTLKDPLADVMTPNNKMNRIMMKILGMIRTVPKGNEYVYELTRKLPGVVFQNYWVTKKNAGRLEEDYKRMGFIAVKLHQCWEDFSIEGEYFQGIASWAEKKGLPLFIHLYCRDEVKKLIRYIEKHPKLKIIIGHLYCVEEFRSVPLSVLENVYFDLSNCYFVSKERFQIGYDAIGGEHFLLGSDTPFGKDAVENTMKMIQKSGIPKEDVEKIWGGNAQRVFGI